MFHNQFSILKKTRHGSYFTVASPEFHQLIPVYIYVYIFRGCFSPGAFYKANFRTGCVLSEVAMTGLLFTGFVVKQRALLLLYGLDISQ